MENDPNKVYLFIDEADETVRVVRSTGDALELLSEVGPGGELEGKSKYGVTKGERAGAFRFNTEGRDTALLVELDEREIELYGEGTMEGGFGRRWVVDVLPTGTSTQSSFGACGRCQLEVEAPPGVMYRGDQCPVIGLGHAYRWKKGESELRKVGRGESELLDERIVLSAVNVGASETEPGECSCVPPEVDGPERALKKTFVDTGPVMGELVEGDDITAVAMSQGWAAVFTHAPGRSKVTISPDPKVAEEREEVAREYRLSARVQSAVGFADPGSLGYVVAAESGSGIRLFSLGVDGQEGSWTITAATLEAELWWARSDGTAIMTDDVEGRLWECSGGSCRTQPTKCRGKTERAAGFESGAVLGFTDAGKWWLWEEGQGVRCLGDLGEAGLSNVVGLEFENDRVFGCGSTPEAKTLAFTIQKSSDPVLTRVGTADRACLGVAQQGTSKSDLAILTEGSGLVARQVSDWHVSSVSLRFGSSGKTPAHLRGGIFHSRDHAWRFVGERNPPIAPIRDVRWATVVPDAAGAMVFGTHGEVLRVHRVDREVEFEGQLLEGDFRFSTGTGVFDPVYNTYVLVATSSPAFDQMVWLYERDGWARLGDLSLGGTPSQLVYEGPDTYTAIVEGQGVRLRRDEKSLLIDATVPPESLDRVEWTGGVRWYLANGRVTRTALGRSFEVTEKTAYFAAGCPDSMSRFQGNLEMVKCSLAECRQAQKMPIDFSVESLVQWGQNRKFYGAIGPSGNGRTRVDGFGIKVSASLLPGYPITGSEVGLILAAGGWVVLVSEGPELE